VALATFHFCWKGLCQSCRQLFSKSLLRGNLPGVHVVHHLLEIKLAIMISIGTVKYFMHIPPFDVMLPPRHQCLDLGQIQFAILVQVCPSEMHALLPFSIAGFLPWSCQRHQQFLPEPARLWAGAVRVVEELLEVNLAIIVVVGIFEYSADLPALDVREAALHQRLDLVEVQSAVEVRIRPFEAQQFLS